MILHNVAEVCIPEHGNISALTHARALILSNKVLVSSINTIYKYCYALVILWNVGKGSIFGYLALYFSFETCYEVDITQVYSSSTHK